MENNTNKSQAEAYREERKARLAKAAAKNAKKSPGAVKAKKIAGKVIAIVLAVVLVLGAVIGTLNFFGTPEKILKISVADKNYSFTVGEFNYYYLNMWSRFASQSAQYDQYGEGMGLQLTGFDASKMPEKQEYLEKNSQMTGVALEDLQTENPTWADLFRYAAVMQIVQVKYMAKQAEDAGITLTEDQTKEIDDSIEDARSTAKKNDYSLNRYLRSSYGNGITEKLLRQIQTETALASAYMEKLQNDLTAAVTDEQINTKYNENRNDYDIVSARIYSFTTDEVKTAEGASEEEIKAANEKAYAETKVKADAFLTQVTDEQSFITAADAEIKKADSESETKAETSTAAKDVTYSDLTSNGEDVAKWAFDSARAVGDKTVIDAGSGTYTVVLLTATAHKDTSVYGNNVRHILVAFPKDDEGNTVKLTDAEKVEYKDKAQAILDEFLKNPTEDNFAALAKEKTEDPGSKENGGLYENINKDSNYVENFLNWAIDANRKVGDTGIVETDYGYHIMYYVSQSGETWYETVKEAIAAENYNAVFDEISEKYIDTVNLNSLLIKNAMRKQGKIISRIILSNFS